MWGWPSRTDVTPDDADRFWQALLRRFDLEHTNRFAMQTPVCPPKLRTPAAADRWTWILIVAHTQLRLARHDSPHRCLIHRPTAAPASILPGQQCFSRHQRVTDQLVSPAGVLAVVASPDRHIQGVQGEDGLLGGGAGRGLHAVKSATHHWLGASATKSRSRPGGGSPIGENLGSMHLELMAAALQ